MSKADRPHVAHNSGQNEWYTPALYIEAARDVMGGIDLDPASSEIAQATVKAEAWYGMVDNGLLKPWHGRVWLNPPYSAELIGRFIGKVVSERIAQACVLVNNGTETAWGQQLLARSNIICFLSSRVRFVSPRGAAGAPLQGQMLCGIDVSPFRFADVFASMGTIVHGTGRQRIEAAAPLFAEPTP